MTTLTIDDAILSTLEEGYTLPASWYTDRAIAELERERILSHSWQYAGPAELVAEPGSFLATRVAHAPVVIVRDEEGELRGFVNVCRHRAHLVASGNGKRKALQCPYHAWTYGLDGCLRSAPRSDREPAFDSSQFSLIPVKVERLGPLLFANLDTESGPLTDVLGEVPAAAGRGRRRPRPAGAPPPLGLEHPGQLEDRPRELPGVLPLPGRPPRPVQGGRRQRRRLPA